MPKSGAKDTKNWLEDKTLYDPLQTRLCDDNGLGLLLSYPFAVPSAKFLLGKSNDVPKLDQHHDIQTVWSLVNLQLDTWHGRDLELGHLADWLVALAEQKNLETVFGSGQPEIELAQGLTARVDKLGKFVRFRSVTTSPEKFRVLIEAVYKARTQPGKTVAQILSDLVDATTPITVPHTVVSAHNGEGSHESTSEWVRDAEIWLRYVLLLSYRKDKTVLLDAKATNGINHVWNKIEPDIVFSRPRDRTRDRQVRGFLRWNRDPDEGHSTAVLADLTQALIGYYEFDCQMPDAEKMRFQTVTSGSEPDRIALADKLDAAIVTLKSINQDCLFSYRPGGILEPLPTTFRESATTAEQGRWYQDAFAIRARVGNAIERATLLAQLYRSPNLSRNLVALDASEA